MNLRLYFCHFLSYNLQKLKGVEDISMDKQTKSKIDAEKQIEIEWYRENIMGMVEQIGNENHLLKIYSYIKVFFDNQ